MSESKSILYSEFKVLLLVAFFLVFSEALLRTNLDRLSGNIAHIKSFDQTIIDINNSNKKTVLFVGNSLIGNAINEELFSRDFAGTEKKDADVYKMVPDGTDIWDWYCIAKNKFTGNRLPGLLINGFAWLQLSDEEKPDPSRLAGDFCGVRDLPDLYQMGLSDTEDVMEYLLAGGSSIFANREAINKRVLSLLIPHYKRMTQLINNEANTRNKGKQQTAPLYTYNLLKKYMSLFNRGGTKIVFISMPVIDDYKVDDKLISLIKSSGNFYLDYRHLAGITPDLFIDPIHLGKAGSRIFTGKLAVELAGARYRK